MSDTGNKVAKELFLKYGGSYFHMEREGELYFYRKWNISKEQENVWIKEYQQENIKLLIEKQDATTVDSCFSTLCRTISEFKNTDSLKTLLEVVSQTYKQYDSFTKIRFSEELLHIAESDGLHKSSIWFDAKKLAIEILKNVIKNPITIDPYYKGLEYLSDILNEEKMMNRARNQLEKWSEI